MTKSPQSPQLLAEAIAIRMTSDGVMLFFHADGKVSTRNATYFGRIPRRWIFAVADDICLYDEAEVPAIIRRAAQVNFDGLRRVFRRVGSGQMDRTVMARVRLRTERDQYFAHPRRI